MSPDSLLDQHQLGSCAWHPVEADYSHTHTGTADHPAQRPPGQPTSRASVSLRRYSDSPMNLSCSEKKKNVCTGRGQALDVDRSFSFPRQSYSVSLQYRVTGDSPENSEKRAGHVLMPCSLVQDLSS